MLGVVGTFGIHGLAAQTSLESVAPRERDALKALCVVADLLGIIGAVASVLLSRSSSVAASA
jgi:hypothetical protein